jgi:uncharacterized protein
MTRFPGATTPTAGPRMRDRYRSATSELYAVLDEALVCHVSFVAAGEPRVLPTLHVQVGGTLYLHASTGSTMTLAARGGLPVAVAVTHVDALVLARSAFHHSVDYRSAVVHGIAALVSDDDERVRILDAFVDRVSPGRARLLRAHTPAELAQTAVLRVPLDNATVKVRDRGVADEPGDLDAPVWAGVLPLAMGSGTPVPDGDAGRYALPALPEFLRA